MKFEFSAGAFIYFKGQGETLILFLKRERDYDVPKGHIEKGETALQAAHRELKEETGLDLPFAPHFVEETSYVFRKGKDRILKRVKFFLGESKTKDVAISDEHLGYEWMTKDEILRKVKYKDIRVLLPRLFDYIVRYEEMLKLNAEYARLPDKTYGWELSRRLVPGDGPLDAKAVMLGEAPGAREDEQGLPFVGRSGEMLSRVTHRAKLKRDSFYITSVVQFRPPENRAPAKEEIAACAPFLKRQLAIINPKFVVLLGRTAASTVLGINEMEANHGRVVEKDGVQYFITYHPAAALRSTTNLEKMAGDFEKLRELISEK
ncbi:RNA pyrophosphohydrolase [uncultured archaeon]|nr:RNA pyrophosphohydrolase [uncultured archaeon]